MKVFIPSKDRASQLHCLLESMSRQLPNIECDIAILYKASSEEFGRGYDKLAQYKFDNIFFHLHEETNFENQFKDYMFQINDNVMLLTDDCVFYRNYAVEDNHIVELMKDNVWCFSFRLGENTTTQWYLSGQQQAHLSNMGYRDIYINDCKYIQWNWKIRPAFENYGYMMSWDGHIYRSTDLFELAQKFSFYNPRTFEDRATKVSSFRDAITKKYMVAPEKSCLFVNTINAVQEEPPPYGIKYKCSPEKLNKLYLGGEIIDLSTFDGLELNSSHEEIPLKFRKV